jgi:lysophospholipase L1-like esterase
MKKILHISVAAVVMGLCSNMAIADEKRIMVFGDSNSWGWTPVDEILPTKRYPENVAWPGVMDAALGEGYTIINESLSARTAATDDDTLGVSGAGLNGLEYLPAAVASHMPLDLVVIMLGTNDTKSYLGQSSLDISLDIMQLASSVQSNTGVATAYPAAQVLIVAPPHLGTIPDIEWLQGIFPEAAVVKSQEVPVILEALASSVDIPFFDAGTVAKVEGVDGIHMLEDAHQALGTAIASEVVTILE